MKIIPFFGVLTCLLYSGAFAQSETNREISIEADVVYGHKAGMALTYDILTPEERNGAAVLFMVSGGWYSSWIQPERLIGMFQFLLDEGFTVIPVRHGSSPWFKVPEALTDVRRAVRHVRFNSEHNRIGVWAKCWRSSQPYAGSGRR